MFQAFERASSFLYHRDSFFFSINSLAPYLLLPQRNRILFFWNLFHAQAGENRRFEVLLWRLQTFLRSTIFCCQIILFSLEWSSFSVFSFQS
jgi:hypothetical protein